MKKEEVKETETKQEVSEVTNGKKKSKFLSELKAFIIIVIIIALVSLGCFVWYKESKNHKASNTTETQEENNSTEVAYNYTILEKDADTNVIIEGDYVIYSTDSDGDEKVTAIYKTDGTKVFEGSYKANEIIMGIDNKLYLTWEEDLDDGNTVIVSRLDDGKITKVYSTKEDYTYFVQLYTYSDDGDVLIGFVGKNDSNDKTYYYNLNGQETVLTGYYFYGDEAVLAEDAPVYTNNPNYVTVEADEDDGIDMKTGLFDLNKKEIVIDTTYDDMYTTFGDGFVAIKNGKAGIINEKQKILVDFNYDFIDIHNDFYVVGKDKKLAIMDNEYNFVTGFDFDFQGDEYYYRLCCTSFNEFWAIKKDDKYLLVINTQNDMDVTYKKNEAYIISSDGKYETIEEDKADVLDDYVYTYSEKNKNYSFYNFKFEKVFDIDLSSFAFGTDYQWFEQFGNYLCVGGMEVCFDGTTGKETDDVSTVVTNDSIKATYNKDNNVDIYLNNEKVVTLDGELDNNLGAVEINNGYYFEGDTKLVIFLEK